MVDEVTTAQKLFAKKLASNNKDERYSAITTLDNFFTSASKLTEVDLLKIWKGLFYCFWMSDKPVVQNELADNLAKLMHTFKPDKLDLFLKTYYITLNREWPGIDRHRLDKYLGFVRRFLNQSFVYMKNNKYKKPVMKVVFDSIFKAYDEHSTEVALHIADIAVTELFQACGDDVPEEAIEEFAGCFLRLLDQTTNKLYVDRIQLVFTALMSASQDRDGTEELYPRAKSPALQLENAVFLDKNLFPNIRFHKLDCKKISKILLEAAKSPDAHHRTKIYEMYEEFKLKAKEIEAGKIKADAKRFVVPRKELRREERDAYRNDVELYIDRAVRADRSGYDLDANVDDWLERAGNGENQSTSRKQKTLKNQQKTKAKAERKKAARAEKEREEAEAKKVEEVKAQPPAKKRKLDKQQQQQQQQQQQPEAETSPAPKTKSKKSGGPSVVPEAKRATEKAANGVSENNTPAGSKNKKRKLEQQAEPVPEPQPEPVPEPQTTPTTKSKSKKNKEPTSPHTPEPTPTPAPAQTTPTTTSNKKRKLREGTPTNAPSPKTPSTPVTPNQPVTISSAKKKSVRWSGKDHVKEFDRFQSIGINGTPSSSPALKSLLTRKQTPKKAAQKGARAAQFFEEDNE